jgi:dTDP-4-amino-4,6-dideoxygalactose transaminase
MSEQKLYKNLPLFNVWMDPNIGDAILPVLHSGKISQYQKVDDFEHMLGQYLNNKHVLTVNSGTSAITLALQILNLPPNSYIASTCMTCLATNTPIVTSGYHIKWIDTNPNTCMMDLDDLEQKLDASIQVCVLVHWGGMPIDLDRVTQIKINYKKRYGKDLYVIEDCAHAFGSEYKGKKIGSHGNICCFSFNAIKNLTGMGDGGCITLPNKEFYDQVLLLRWFGIDRINRTGKCGKDFRIENDVPRCGYKMHIGDPIAAACICNFPGAVRNISHTRKLAELYKTELSDVMIYPCNGSNPNWWLFTILVPNKKEIVDAAKKVGIMISQVHGRNDVHSCMDRYKDNNLPGTDIIEQKMVCIPCGYWINLDDEAYRIINFVRNWIDKN